MQPVIPATAHAPRLASLSSRISSINSLAYETCPNMQLIMTAWGGVRREDPASL